MHRRHLERFHGIEIPKYAAPVEVPVPKYVKPEDATAPSGRLRELEVIYPADPSMVTAWSAAWFTWDEKPRTLGLRWNGSTDGSVDSSPQSRGHATWFVVPDELREVIKDEIEAIIKRKRTA